MASTQTGLVDTSDETRGLEAGGDRTLARS